eukprot:6849829-Pyramimonas_sp.AAC.1
MGGSCTFRDLRDKPPPLDWIGSTPKRLVLSTTGCARRANSWGAARKVVSQFIGPPPALPLGPPAN